MHQPNAPLPPPSLFPPLPSRYYTGQATFPAFAGISLTTFDVTGATGFGASQAQTLVAGDAGALRSYSVKVTNTGSRTGDQVVFMFAKPGNLTAQAPSPLIRRLVGFERVHLAPGASAVVDFNVTVETLQMVSAGREGNFDFSSLSSMGDIVSTPGTFTVQFSTGGANADIEQLVTVTGDEIVLAPFPKF